MTLDLAALLAEEELGHYSEALCQATTLPDAQSLLAANRVAFLARLKELGVSKVGERQRLANAIGRAQRAGRIDAVAPVPHMSPCTWSQTDEELTLRLRLPAGTASAAVHFDLDVNSLEVRVAGERTSVCGRLAGLVRPADSTWELERAPPAAETDVMLISLAKAKPGAWAGPTSRGAVALPVAAGAYCRQPAAQPARSGK